MFSIKKFTKKKNFIPEPSENYFFVVFVFFVGIKFKIGVTDKLVLSSLFILVR